MPTGYTDAIKDGIDFKTFAMNCARAFGACVTLREEPGGGEAIPESFAPSTYHTEALAKARAELTALELMTTAQCESEAQKAFDTAESRRLLRLKEVSDLRASYETMLAKVQAWTPPTDDHKGLKEFMVEQIVESISWDCDGNFYKDPVPRLSGAEWLAQRRSEITDSLSYRTKNQSEEEGRAASRTAWVKALRDSLK